VANTKLTVLLEVIFVVRSRETEKIWFEQ